MLWGMPSRRMDWNDPLVDHLDEAADRSLPNRYKRAQVGHDRVARQGHAALARAGMPAKVVDPSFGDNARQVRVPLHGGYELAVTPPMPHPQGAPENTTSWHAAVHPPGVSHFVGGEEVHQAELGTFHPRELHERVQGYLGRPDVMKAMSDDGDQLVGGMQREQRNARRAPLLNDMAGGDHLGAIQKHLGPQFGG